MWANLLNEENFQELRPGAFKELREKLKKRDMLYQLYEKELGANKVKQLHAEVNVELWLQSGPSANLWNSEDHSSNLEATITSEPIPSSSDSSTKAKPTLAGLVGVGSHDNLEAASSSKVVNQRVTQNQPWCPTQDVSSQSAVVKKKILTATSSNNQTSASKDGEADKGNAANSRPTVKPSCSLPASPITDHHRAPDFKDGSQLQYHCVCGHEFIRKMDLKSHLIRKLFGNVFKCPIENCSTSYCQFGWIKTHCMKEHGIKTLDKGCSYCGDQCEDVYNLRQHLGKCQSRLKLHRAMKTTK